MVVSNPEVKSVLKQWRLERYDIREYVKVLFNPQFGSIFRTYHNPTYFSRRLMRLADIYMSNVTNLLQYSLNHTFYVRRWPLPHEPEGYNQYDG
ncbi:unnamed protein product [Soboliphyme baturini]|uniref:Galactosylceramide sulfotransferase-like n=1 Tax=Soboliphyme baturini TaxID=241478 RepID=A0A183JA57_9BILA|nr:unnamed protein product [Soboliphyme baturini]